MQETWVQSLGQEDPLEEEMATHSSILAWKLSWTQEAGGYCPWGHKSHSQFIHPQSKSLPCCHPDLRMDRQCLWGPSCSPQPGTQGVTLTSSVASPLALQRRPMASLCKSCQWNPLSLWFRPTLFFVLQAKCLECIRSHIQDNAWQGSLGKQQLWGSWSLYRPGPWLPHFKTVSTIVSVPRDCVGGNVVRMQSVHTRAGLRTCLADHKCECCVIQFIKE